MVGGVSWGYVGPSWGYVGPSWGLCWPILGLCWPILGLCWPSLGLCWPILELCWPILGLCCPILGPCWPLLGAMLALLDAYVGPGWPILSHKIRKKRKNAKSTKHRKTRDILAGPGGSPAGGAAPLSYGEERTAVRQGHGQGAPGRIYEAYAWQPGAGKSRPVSPSWCCCCWYKQWLGPLEQGIRAYFGICKGRDKKTYIERTGSQCLFVPCCCCWPMLALFGRRFTPVLALGWPM